MSSRFGDEDWDTSAIAAANSSGSRSHAALIIVAFSERNASHHPQSPEVLCLRTLLPDTIAAEVEHLSTNCQQLRGSNSHLQLPVGRRDMTLFATCFVTKNNKRSYQQRRHFEAICACHLLAFPLFPSRTVIPIITMLTLAMKARTTSRRLASDSLSILDDSGSRDVQPFSSTS